MGGRWCVSKESFQRSTETEVGERETMEKRVKSENRKLVPSVFSLFKYRKNYISLITLESCGLTISISIKQILLDLKTIYAISEIIPSNLFLN